MIKALVDFILSEEGLWCVALVIIFIGVLSHFEEERKGKIAEFYMECMKSKEHTHYECKALSEAAFPHP